MQRSTGHQDPKGKRRDDPPAQRRAVADRGETSRQAAVDAVGDPAAQAHGRPARGLVADLSPLMAAAPGVARLARLETRANPRRVPPAVAGGGEATQPVVQGAWEFDPEEGVWESDEGVDGRMWEYRTVQRPRAGALPGGPQMESFEQYRYMDFGTGEDTAWRSYDEWLADGITPPMGAQFAEQRALEEDYDEDSGTRAAFLPAPSGEPVPEPVARARAILRAGVLEIQERVDFEKRMLDGIMAEEFPRVDAVVGGLVAEVRGGAVSPASLALLRELMPAQALDLLLRSGTVGTDAEEALKAGLRYKRVYEHEQNLLTINRRARKDRQALLQAVRDGVPELQGVTLEGAGDEEGEAAINGGFGDRVYRLGTFLFGDARFEAVSEAGGGLNAVFRHRTSGKEHVRDRYGRFVRRYVRRAIRFEDAVSLGRSGTMEAKLGFDDPIGGKESQDYGDRDLGGTVPTYEQKVMGQIRGYSRLVSATGSGRLATSTSRSTYHSPFGSVLVDLARVDPQRFSEAYSEDALAEIFGVPDLGSLEFVPKHASGESSEAKAARDAFRAREIVLPSTPPGAVLAREQVGGERGIAVLGLTQGATEGKLLEALPADLRGRVTFMEVNTRYKRNLGGHEGRSAFIFFDPGVDPGAAAVAVRAEVARRLAQATAAREAALADSESEDGGAVSSSAAGRQTGKKKARKKKSGGLPPERVVAEDVGIDPGQLWVEVVPPGLEPSPAPDEQAYRQEAVLPALGPLRRTLALVPALVRQLPPGHEGEVADLVAAAEDVVGVMAREGAGRDVLVQRLALDLEAFVTRLEALAGHLGGDV